MPRIPKKEVRYHVCRFDEDKGVPFMPVGTKGQQFSKRKALQDLKETQRKYGEAFLVKVTEERMKEGQ